MRSLFAAVLCLFVLASPRSPAAPPSPGTPGVAWTLCDESLVGSWPSLGDRLQCARIQVPADHDDPSRGNIDLGIIRVRALDPAHRIGTLFMNFGGPGGNPMVQLPEWADDWQHADPAEPILAPRHEVASRFDLLGVVPRGLHGGWIYDCLPLVPAPYRYIPRYTDEWNLDMVDKHASDLARRCKDHPFHDIVSTTQNAHDMEFVRRALGEPALHYYGLSYGSWLGTWYAAMYPEKVGRMVMDSIMDATSTFDNAVQLSLEAREERLRRRVLTPVASRPGLYGMSSSIEQLRSLIRRMHPDMHRLLAPLIDTPAAFVAGIRFDDWHRTMSSPRPSEIRDLVMRTRFSPDDRFNEVIRSVAVRMIPALFPPSDAPEFDLGPDGDAVHVATMCNDDAWPGNFDYWRDRIRDRARRFVTSNGEDSVFGMLCGHWASGGRRRPDLTHARSAPAFLMVQAEYDGATPLKGARTMLGEFPNAYLVVARNVQSHGVFTVSNTPCVEHAVADFLVRGTLPATRESSCLGEGDDTWRQNTTRRPLHDEFGGRMAIWQFNPSSRTTDATHDFPASSHSPGGTVRAGRHRCTIVSATRGLDTVPARVCACVAPAG